MDVGRITPQNFVARTGSEPVFRADNRAPDVIFAEGFQPKDVTGNADLQTHVDESPDGMLVSASRSREGAVGRWQYEIHAPSGSGIDFNATAEEYGNLEPNWAEEEIGFPGGIDTRYIKSVQEFDEFDNPVGEPRMNPHFNENS